MSDIKIRAARETDVTFSSTLLAVKTKYGLPDVSALAAELEDMRDVLFGREPSPINAPYMALMEVATAYFCRAQEIDLLIHQAEREGDVSRGSSLYRFRTGELRSFIELAKAAANLGSRRLTDAQLAASAREVT